MKDKLLHFGIAFAFGILAILLKEITMLEWTFWLAICLFLIKEIYDLIKKNPTGFSWLDLFADFFGFGIGLTITNYVMIIIK